LISDGAVFIERPTRFKLKPKALSITDLFGRVSKVGLVNERASFDLKEIIGIQRGD
jgi:hypothetical protein